MRYYADKDFDGQFKNRPVKNDSFNGAGAAAWAESREIDDIDLPNELHTWKGAKVKIYLKTEDVIHSFFLPQLRLKQDALPGKTIPIWFEVTEANVEYQP